MHPGADYTIQVVVDVDSTQQSLPNSTSFSVDGGCVCAVDGRVVLELAQGKDGLLGLC